MIRKIVFAAALFAALPAYGADEDAVVQTITAFNDAMTRGDMKAAAGSYTGSPVIIDEFAPHVWSGVDAVQQWGADYETYAKAGQMTEPAIALRKPEHVTVEGDRGYAVFPATFNFMRKGAAVHEAGTMTFALQKVDGAWKIAGWSWSTK